MDKELKPTPGRARRYPFVISIELTDLQSEVHFHGRTSDLSLYGCRVVTLRPFPPGAKVRIRISHQSANFAALGKVSYNSPDGGMGITFTQIDPANQSVLEKWVEKLRSH